MRWNNETPLPRPPVIETGKDITIPSRDAGRTIPLRIFLPNAGGRQSVKGTFLHIHGGGWVLQSEKYQDGLLDFMAQRAQLAVVSVGIVGSLSRSVKPAAMIVVKADVVPTCHV